MYSFPKINVSDTAVKGTHLFWGHGSHGWSPFMGFKQVEAPYLYGYGVRIARLFVGVCRERYEERPLVRLLPEDQAMKIVQSTKENQTWESSADEMPYVSQVL